MSRTLKVHINGECTVSRNDKWGYPVYSAKLSTMNKEGAWEYNFIQLQFPAGHDIPNNAEIKINDAFLTFFCRKNGTKENCIRITSYDIMNQAAGDIDIPVDIDADAELPF